MTTGRRIAVLLTAAFTLLAGCGQYQGVHEKLAGGSNGLQPGAQGASGDLPPDASAGSGPAGSGDAGSDSAGSGSNGGSSGGGKNAAGGNTTGVTDDTITIGVHAPLTGAAPLKASSFDSGKQLYWTHGNKGKPINIYGRKVKVIFADDRYRPSHARQVCQQMAEQGKAFMLIGGGGTDQIQACARYAASQNIPYMSAGVTEIGLRGLKNYFAASQSYPTQARLLASYIKRRIGVTDASKVAAVITNTPNFDDTAQAFQRAFPGVKIFRPEKNESGRNMANNLCTGTAKKYDVVFPLAAPTYYLELAAATTCKPQYVGVGVSMGLDSVASAGCQLGQATENARFFGPAPAYEDARRGKWDPGFIRAANSAGVEADDIMWMLWGQSKVLHQLLLRAGKDLSRQKFVRTTETARVRTNVFPELNYSPSNHFGARQVHVLKNVCQRRGNAAGYYVTEQAFARSF